MCDNKDEWRGFSTGWYKNEFFIFEECMDCGDYRARMVDDLEVVRPKPPSGPDMPSPGDPSGDGSRWTE